ncbi:flagellin [Aromatoleum toluclasticum]|uniref:flagellin n=1 Tax=Aromatoleum toluclasticum TaxID=92003 RepID=UPI001D18F8C5|nr:flagellin [Aromatoleum toluclasticum]MCC4115896.1 flagellin [Aromatoleum toluclasticum]
MAQVINTNVSSLNAQRNLNTSGAALATSLQRLSSGLRINSAKDDAAGLAISERFGAQIRGLNQAVRNANDGISLAQTAEGALGEIGNNLQRIRELAVQSRNATNSAEDRTALQKEVIQLKAEIDRVANNTTFNGKKLIDGSFTNEVFQVGADQGQTIAIAGIADANIAALGSWTDIASVTGGALTAGTVSGLTVNGETVADTVVTADAAGATALANAINTALTDGGVTTVSASVSGSNVVLTASDNSTSIVVGGTVTNSGLTAATTAPEAQTGFSSLDISTTLGADNAILAMDAALTAVNGARADLGAIQNRFSSTIANLQTTSENLSASRSRILDADFAQETANLTRGQILQQAGTAMLAQANSLPNNVLSLLRG